MDTDKATTSCLQFKTSISSKQNMPGQDHFAGGKIMKNNIDNFIISKQIIILKKVLHLSRMAAAALLPQLPGLLQRNLAGVRKNFRS